MVSIEVIQSRERLYQSCLINELQCACHFKSFITLVLPQEMPVLQRYSLVLEHNILGGDEVEISLLPTSLSIPLQSIKAFATVLIVDLEQLSSRVSLFYPLQIRLLLHICQSPVMNRQALE